MQVKGDMAHCHLLLFRNGLKMEHIIFRKPEQSQANGFKTHLLATGGIGMMTGHAPRMIGSRLVISGIILILRAGCRLDGLQILIEKFTI